MSWPASLGAGVITAIVAGFLAGWTANLAVGWYHMSSFEGASGYFVISMALLGMLGGLILGIVVSRLLSSGAGSSFFKSLGLSQAIVVGLILGIGCIVRLLADVPPTLHDEVLMLSVEIRWPQGQSPSELSDSGEWSVRLGSSVNHTMRASSSGPLWREDARQEAGSWIVPGAVELFTSRGKRVLDVLPDGIVENGWILPLPGHPDDQFLNWSEWLPRAREGEPPLPDGFRYRFRVAPRSQPIRTQSLGPFEIDTIAQSFSEVRYGNQPMSWHATAHFLLRYGGQPVVIETPDEFADGTIRYDQINAVAALAGPKPALLVQVDAPRGEGLCYLVWGEGDQVKTRLVGMGGDGLRAPPLTSDTALFDRARNWRLPDGRFDFDSFATPGQYLFREVVVDTRTLAVRAYPTDDQGRLIGRIPPLAVSPDGDSFVQIEFDETSDFDYKLVVTHLGRGDRYRVPVDRVQTRFPDLDQLDPNWVAHYFDWQPGPDGAERLVVRSDAVPLPYRGRLSQQGSYREYRIAGAREELRTAVIEFLVAEFAADPLPGNPGDYSRELKIGDATVSVSYDEDYGHVGIWMSPSEDTSLVATIAQRFDDALQTGHYDDFFVH